ncbi:MAG: glucose-1-phosphate adenylyltransferase subunit GlgD [Lachnospiraceae bacterium]|nr:glucose-1-phosphate adenylyltransferase subunit GlgD [Lachnospiraceae bacterium]
MKALGMILAGGNNRRMRELSSRRAIAAMPMAGSFRAVDFTLSNMSNSGIGTVAVITQYSSRSLDEHLSSSKWWDFGRKQGGLYLLNPTITPENNDWYRGTADAISQNLNFLYKRHEPYVVIAPGDGIYKLDYNDVIDFHSDNDADITVVCKDFPEGADVSRFGVLQTDEKGRIMEWEEKPVASPFRTVSTGIYVIRRRLLISLMEQCREMEWTDLVRDVIMRQKNVMNIMAYRLDSYWTNISTVKAYYDANMDFLKDDVRKHFFHEYPSIQTKVDDYAPAKYNTGADVKGSLIANGVIMNGQVSDSILFRKVFVGNGAVIKNSLVFKDSYISDGAILEYCIVEAGVTIPTGAVHKGTPEKPLIITE